MKTKNAPFLTGGTTSNSMDMTSCCESVLYKPMPKKGGNRATMSAKEDVALYAPMPKKGGKGSNMTLPTGGANNLVN